MCIGRILRANFWAVIKTNQAILTEEEGFDVNGQKAIYLSNKVPIQDANGKIIGIVGISLDITERKEIEQELMATKEVISQLNAIKTEFLKALSSNIAESLESLPAIIQQIKLMETRKDNKEELDEAIFTLDNLLVLLAKIKALPNNIKDETLALQNIMEDVNLFFHAMIGILGLVAKLRYTMLISNKYLK
jgi:two-component system aerobic respiration control sensor histidine kinase ArcB